MARRKNGGLMLKHKWGLGGVVVTIASLKFAPQLWAKVAPFFGMEVTEL